MRETPPIRLGVNIDHVATLRQARRTKYPALLQAALLAEQAGADAITAHLREDRRHIQDRDIELLREMIQTRLNLEMAVTGEMISIARRIRPAACCLVPEKREELTTEGGLNVVAQFDKISRASNALSDADIEVSLCIDAEPAQVDAAAKTGVPFIELHTGHYADAEDATQTKHELERLRRAAAQARAAGLGVNAGHGLHYHNVEAVCRIAEIGELNIGHSIIATALFTGLEKAVADMKAIMRAARSPMD